MVALLLGLFGVLSMFGWWLLFLCSKDFGILGLFGWVLLLLCFRDFGVTGLFGWWLLLLCSLPEVLSPGPGRTQPLHV